MSFKKETIGDAIESITNGVNCKQNKDGIGVKITRIETIANREINYEKTGFGNLTEAEKKKYKLIKGDILFSHINSPIHVGKTAVYNGLEDLYHGTNLLKLRVKNHINPYYFKYFLDEIFQSGYWRKTSKQSVNQASVNQTDIKKINFFYPPLTEQQSIVAKLDAAFAEIDKKNEIINHNIDNAKKLKIEFITKELNKLSKADFKKLSSICVLTRGPFGGSLTKAMFVQNGYAVYEQKHAIKNNFETVKYFISEEKFNEMKRFELRNGDLLMSCSGTLGKIAIVPKNIKKGIINQALLKITPNEKIILKEYLKLVISSDYFQNILSDFSKGAAQINVPSVNILKNILIPVPNIDKQKEILKRISIIEDLQLENLYKKKKSLVMSLKSAIVSNLIIKDNKVI